MVEVRYLFPSMHSEGVFDDCRVVKRILYLAGGDTFRILKRKRDGYDAEVDGFLEMSALMAN